ncbi:MAG: co-chaperone GroES [Bacteroidetes bacterium]|nr:co-chaperone GroES [Bacteroidota bacterium]
MSINLDVKDLDKLIVVGDRVLIKPRVPQSKTKSGLFLPPGVQENDKVQAGYVIKVGPGYPVPEASDPEEKWKPSGNEPRYIPLQPKEGDLALYMQGSSVEIEFNSEKLVVVPQSAILLLLRDKGLFG